MTTHIGEAILRQARARSTGTTLVAVDGAGGSGKSTLAATLARQLGDCAVVHGDDFYRPMPDAERERLNPEQGYRRYFDWERLADQVLRPLRAGEAARYQKYDWATGRLGAWETVARGGVVLVEGVYTARPELADFYDLTVFVDTPRETCLDRLRARGENSAEWITRWRAAEDHYLRTTRPAERATLVVAGA
ncbi:uridine kinase family protein [Streptomyces litchfieldiae]|uniref:AAA family ATPase n=1 Tax=Streptomyces litchfieldiae TaxID=3075543 RepID=A0ABU2MZW2_9ACTN|nr:AAA family ATPase [Streptomyces sp. DSM 44938]MDT0347065.1 AAA family ATPase [Streptomyces sp. DSM 44938]